MNTIIPELRKVVLVPFVVETKLGQDEIFWSHRGNSRRQIRDCCKHCESSKLEVRHIRNNLPKRGCLCDEK